MPAELCDTVRFTEFFIALVAPLGNEHSFDDFYPTVRDTEVVDGRSVFLGHGGTLQVWFPWVWGPADVQFGTPNEMFNG